MSTHNIGPWYLQNRKCRLASGAKEKKTMKYSILFLAAFLIGGVSLADHHDKNTEGKTTTTHTTKKGKKAEKAAKTAEEHADAAKKAADTASEHADQAKDAAKAAGATEEHK